jgi:hypothetical protein
MQTDCASGAIDCAPFSLPLHFPPIHCYALAAACRRSRRTRRQAIVKVGKASSVAPAANHVSGLRGGMSQTVKLSGFEMARSFPSEDQTF